MADTGRTVWADGFWAEDFWAEGFWASGDAPEQEIGAVAFSYIKASPYSIDVQVVQ